MTDVRKPDFSLTLARAVIGRCPNCGQGRLFARYLKLVNHCEKCNEHLGEIRAEDGPAWLTIVLVGHIIAPLLLLMVPGSMLPDWLLMVVWLAAALALTFIILPRAKGLFVAILWRAQVLRANS